MTILYVAVNYGTSGHAQHFVECLERDPHDARLIVVDNTEAERRVPLSINPTLADVIYDCPAPQNLGYFGGARYGVSSLWARKVDADWTVVSNVDVIFDSAQVRATLDQYDTATVGIIAPAIMSEPAMEELNPFMRIRPSPMRMRAYKIIFSRYAGYVAYSWLSRLIRRRAWSGRPRGIPCDEMIYAPHGAFMIFSREYFKRGGNLDHLPFLFGEEITVAEQARALSLPVLYCPRIRLRHEQHASMSKLPTRLHHRFVSSAASHVADTYFC